MKRLLLTLLLAISLTMAANPIDENTASGLAKSFWKANHIMGVRNGITYQSADTEAHLVNVAQRCGYTEFYIFNNEAGKGFVIIAADDCVSPVLGYSYDNSLDWDNLPPGFKDLLEDYAMQIRTAVAARATATEEIRDEWKCLHQGKTLPIRSEKAVTPLIATQWGQDPYYNALCPFDYSAQERTLTGCVATSMAQVMKYWSYPEHGTGTHSYTPYTHPEYGSLYVDFSSVNYQWSAMPNNVNSSNNAVATLMYHCGVSVDMDYGIGGYPDYGSAAYTASSGGKPSAELALKTYFDYKSSLHIELKSNHTDAQWINILKNELDNARPMMFGGYGTGGHSFVCDGYNNNNYFHFNWGWEGYCDGYFNINNLNPSTQNYSNNQQALVGIEPAHSGNGGGGGGGGGSATGFDLVYNANLNMENEFWFYDDLSVYAEIANVGNGSFGGYMGAGVFRKENNQYRFVDVMDTWNMVSDPLDAGFYTYGTMGRAGGPPYTPGSYVVAILYSMDGDMWSLIDNGNYEDAYFDIVYSAQIETYSDFNITSGAYLFYDETATVNVDVWNSGSTDFYGKFRVNLSNPDGSWAQNIGILNCTNGLHANSHYTNGLNFTGKITVEPGTYYIELAYQPSNSDSWYYAGASRYSNPVSIEVVAPNVTHDPYESNNTVSAAYALPFNLSGGTASIATNGANLHDESDVDYYKVQFNSSGTYTLKAKLNDSYHSDNGTYYTVDAKVAYSIDGSNWSEFFDDEVSSFTTSAGTVYFCVMPYFEGRTGTYQLNINITAGTGVMESNEPLLLVYPNPVDGILNIDCQDAREIRVYNPLGSLLKAVTVEGDRVQVDMSELPCGTYLIQAVGDSRVATARVVKTE